MSLSALPAGQVAHCASVSVVRWSWRRGGQGSQARHVCQARGFVLVMGFSLLVEAPGSAEAGPGVHGQARLLQEWLCHWHVVIVTAQGGRPGAGEILWTGQRDEERVVKGGQEGSCCPLFVS